MTSISKIEGEIQLPKLNEYYDLVLTEEKVRVGELFTKGDYIVGIASIYEIKNETYIEVKQYDITGKKFCGSWENIEVNSFIEKYSESWIPDFEKYSTLADDYLFNGKELVVEVFEEQSSALVHKTNKLMLESIYGGLEVKKKHLELVRNMAHIKIIEQKNKLEKIKRDMESKLAIFHKEMNKIYRVISMIELYLGVEEELHHIKQGEPADINEPLSLRQLVLYADEELGNINDGGIDYTQLNIFDEWIVRDKNYEILLPEKRGIVALKPRRFDKKYSSNPIENAILNRWNKQTYFLIRNGENIYRVCTEHLEVGKTLFPLRNEVSDLFSDSVSEEDRFDKRVKESRRESITNQYMRISLFIQGLLDRTEVFSPIQPDIKVNDLQENGGINLVYDAEMLLPSNKLSFKNWMKEINSTVSRGSRIVLRPDTSDRFSRNGCNRYRDGEGFGRYYERYQPEIPNTGLYIIEEYIDTDGNKFPAVYYNSKDSTWGGDGFYERKNRISWVINLEKSWYLNYDRISIEDIDFYLNSRLDRPNYLDNLPLLRTIKKHLIEEQKKEEHFKLMLKGIAISQGIKDDDNLNKNIQESIDWWKYKNIWKRPITQDDEKACRMIQRYLLNLYKS